MKNTRVSAITLIERAYHHRKRILKADSVAAPGQTGLEARCSARAGGFLFNLIGKSERPVSFECNVGVEKSGSRHAHLIKARVICR